MGSSVSKTASKASRRFPTRAPGSMSATPRASQPSRKIPQASTAKTDAISSDAMDPDMVSDGFSKRLHKMGIVDPNPTFSPSSTASQDAAQQQLSQGAGSYPTSASNSTLVALESRRRLQERADTEFEGLGQRGSPGREFLDIGTISRILVLRERGVGSREIESSLKLKAGVVDRLGSRGTIAPVNGGP